MADKDQILADMADIVNDITGVDQSGVEIPDEESKNIKTVGDAVNYIIEHKG